MNNNDIIHGFKVIRVVHIDEIKADMYEMLHEKTNAKAIWLKRDDENKTFSIAFKTTPEDDTGIFHILEHSVLNGSKRYPVKEPFVDLLKGSLQTFLNAMTFPDKTVYPVSSRNDKDFINLMRVYLDAVFNPLVLDNPNGFYQEGWHFELNNVDDEVSYKGVVFNEMKGAFSSPDSIRYRLMMHSLFPDTCYGNESGGDPEYITDLTYKQFCDAHRKYYNPSNSYIFLDGDMDVEKVLGIIDDEYLSKYSSDNEKIEIKTQSPVIAEKVIKEYEISPEESTDNKAQIAYGYVIGNFDEYEKTAAFSLISSVLCDNNESPLKKIILNNNLGEDIYFSVQDGVKQPYVEIDVINTDLDKEELIDKTITDELKRIVLQGLDKQELEATLNQREFKAKERDFGGAPKGLVFAINSLDSWLYDGDPIDSLCFDKLYASLREKINTSYYEDLLNEFILNSKHHAKILLKPSNTLGAIKAEKERNKLDEISSKWSLEDREELVKLNKNLQAFQALEDTPEQKDTLPKLHLEDLKTSPTKYDLSTEKYNDNEVIKHDLDTNGISYMTLYSKVDDLKLEEYTVLNQVLSLLGKLKTAKYDVLELSRRIRSILGDFNFSFSPMMTYHSKIQKNIVYLSWSSLFRNDKEACELIKEIIYNTDFSDKQAIRDILKQNIFALQQAFTNAGHSLALQRASAYSSPLAVVSEYAGGYEAYRYLKNLDDNYDELADEYIEKLKEIYKKLFIKERYSISIASDNYELIRNSILDDAPSKVVGQVSEKKVLGNLKEGIIVPSNVSYAAKNSFLKDEDYNVGSMYVMSNILTYDYLWSNIRVKNGAYGCGFRSTYSKASSFYSYRDPSPSMSLDIFTNTIEYLKEFLSKQDSIENYIVGTTGDFDPLLSNKTSIKISALEYMMEISYEDKKEMLKQILNTSKDDLHDLIKLFEIINSQDNICVVGNSDAINNCKQLEKVFDLNQK